MFSINCPGIRTQILFIAGIPVLFCSLIMVIVVYRGSVLQGDQIIKQQGRLLAAQLAAAMEYTLSAGDIPQLVRDIEGSIRPAADILRTPVQRVSVFDRDDHLLYELTPPNPSNTPSLSDMWSWLIPFGEVQTFSESIYMNPLFQMEASQRRYLGKVTVDLWVTPSRNGHLQQFLGDMGLLLIALTAALALARWTGQRLTRSLLEIAQAVKCIKNGDLRVRVSRKETNEIGTLQEGVDMLAAAIASAQDKLEAELAKVRGEYLQALDKLQVQTRKAQQANRTKSLFLAKISHEMRTPLYSIQGLTEYLLKLPQRTEEKQAIHKITHSARTLGEIIGNILDFTQMENGQYKSRPTLLDLWSETENVVETIGALMAEQSLYLDVIVDPAIPSALLGDTKALRAIVGNLLSNAVKFTETGGICIWLSVEGTHPNGIVDIRLGVRDTGQGIPAEHLDMIFAPFEQGDGAQNRRYPGTGLGLAIVAGYCDNLGGQITVDSQVGAGTTFNVVLPFQAAYASNQVTWCPSGDLIDLRAFVVNPRSTFCESVHCRLASLGLEVVKQAVSPSALVSLPPPAQPYDLLVVHELSAWPPDNLAELIQSLRRWARCLVSFENHSVTSSIQRLYEYDITALWSGTSRRMLQETLRTLLLKIPPEQSQLPDNRGQRAYLEGKKILVAEDFDINRDIIVYQLRNHGLVVLEAQDGNQAVHMAATEPALDLVLMDIQMPGKNGISAIREIRNLAACAALPILGFTASADKTTHCKVLKAGANAVLAKPISEEELITAIYKTLVSAR